jgi:hypothetical protein
VSNTHMALMPNSFGFDKEKIIKISYTFLPRT